MLVLVSHDPIVVPKKTMPDTLTREATDIDILIPSSNTYSPDEIIKKEISVKIHNILSSSKIFMITIHYLLHAYHVKVLKIIYRGNESIYKIVLSSQISDNIRVCWLQHELQGWIILIGHNLDKRLIRTLTSAIESQE
ncbi:MAG TPA: hypothetical protein VIL78_14230 [Hanamia sp.]|jgi:hypothetical protein